MSVALELETKARVAIAAAFELAVEAMGGTPVLGKIFSFSRMGNIVEEASAAILDWNGEYVRTIKQRAGTCKTHEVNAGRGRVS